VSSSEQNEYWHEERHADYHRRQFAEPYRSTVFVGRLVAERIFARKFAGQALDVACGAGANMVHLGREFPNLVWTGVDLVKDAFALGARLMTDCGVTCIPKFVQGDLYRLRESVGRQQFDVVFSLQTLSWLPAYEQALDSLLSVVRPGGWLVISSLFTDALVDAKIELTQYDDVRCVTGTGGIYYNVYCLERFEAECRSRGATRVEAHDFAMDVDLPRPANRLMGTYTERLADGRRLQLSGPLLMPWRVVLVRSS
jgi:SAM-dependent methyltransferase